MNKKFFLSTIILVLIFTCNIFAEEYKDIPNLAKVKKQVRHYYKKGQWEKDLDTQYTKADKILDEYEGDKSKTAIVFDIDETVLTSFYFLEKIDFAYESFLPQWASFVLKGDAPAMPRALTFYRKAQKMGFATFFVTGRPEKYKSISESNLNAQGFTNYTGIYHRPQTHKKVHSAAEAKTKAREDIESKGYKILLNIGDQESDLAGGHAENTILLPNLIYIVP